MFSTFGRLYALVRVRDTGECMYFKLAEPIPSVSSPEAIDAEPLTRRRPYMSVGARVWFHNRGRRFLLEVVKKSSARGRRVTLKCVTGWDEAREVEWPQDMLLDLDRRNPLLGCLRSAKPV